MHHQSDYGYSTGAVSMTCIACGSSKLNCCDGRMQDPLEREANRQGASDGRHGYPRNSGDWTGRNLAAYDRGYVTGRDAATGQREG